MLRLSNPLIWRCPTARILALYDQHAGASHLDVGVGTGWYLDRCRFPAPAPRVGLMDLNADSLAFAADRIARYRPETYRFDVLGAPATGIAPFASIGMTYLLHCLPGDIAAKAKTFDTVRAVPGRRRRGVRRHDPVGRRPDHGCGAGADAGLQPQGGVLQRRRHPAGPARGADRRFRSVEITVVGCVALFVAREPR